MPAYCSTMRWRMVLGAVGLCLFAVSAVRSKQCAVLDDEKLEQDAPGLTRRKRQYVPVAAAAVLSGVLGAALIVFLLIFAASPAGLNFNESARLTALTAVGAILIALSGFFHICAHVLREADTECADKISEWGIAMVFLGGLMLVVEPVVKIWGELSDQTLAR